MLRNTWLRTLRDARRALLWWSLGLVGMATLMIAVFPTVRDNPDLDDTITRLRAYEAASADVLYAPRLRELDDVRRVCEAVTRPVNVLAHSGLSMPEIVSAGG